MSRRLRPLAGALGLVLALMVTPVAPAAAASIDAHGSAEQVYATGLAAKAKAVLLDSAGRTVKTKNADGLGGVLFRNVKPGSGYRVQVGSTKSDPLTVFGTGSAPPDPKIYDQKIAPEGYQYLTTRDGTKLAIYVHSPNDVTGVSPLGYLPVAPGNPTPTLIEYSGYGYANPAGPESGIAVVANALGYTVVDVNMRGSGCSGGAFDFFEPLQNLDGYDVIETIARQPWVLHNKVGMMGISYGGISQLFTAQTQPPSLAAITPLSVIDATQTTLYPGGVLNTGFAVEWGEERIHAAKPAGPKTGQAWAYKRIQEGDEVCKANQALRGESANLRKKIRDNDHYVAKVADPLAPITFVDKIKVPVFMACQFEDEQTGGHCPTLAEHMTGTDKKWFTYTNGTHVDSLDPATFNRWYDFLQLYVAQQAPAANAARAAAVGPVVVQQGMGVTPPPAMPADPIQQIPSYDAAKAAYEKLPQIRVLFDNGAGGDPGSPLPGFEQSFPSFPVPGTKARTFWFGPGSALADARPAKAAANAFTWNPKARTPTDFTGDTAAGENGLWTPTPPYKWLSPPPGSAASYVSAPLKANTVIFGAGYVRAWIKSSKPSVDLQATVTEVRPDGKEVFVQNGWIRSDWRKLDPKKSTPLEPWPTGLLQDIQPTPSNRFVRLTIPLYYQGHAYRAGSRVRVYITAPNGDQPIWAFAKTHPAKGTAKVTIGYGGKTPSSLVLPEVPGVDVPTGLPPCPGLRGEPCRDYTAYKNGR